MAVYYFYKICSLDNTFIYIGSTTNFNKRMNDHKSNCYNEKSKKYNYKLYKTIRENNGIENFIFEMIESMTTDDKEIVLKHEQQLIIKYNSNLNTYRSFMSDEDKKQYQKQYRIDNKEQLQQQKKQYIIDNKEQIRQQKKQYRIDNKEC